MALLRSQPRGTLAKVAHGVGYSRAGVAKWSQIPAELVVRVEEVTGIDRSMLRPDLFLYVRRVPHDVAPPIAAAEESSAA